MKPLPREQLDADALRERLDALAQSPKLLVATDYDGTLAPIVADPASAHPLRESIVALRMLCEQPDTHVAIISGRALTDLEELTRLSDVVHLVGSHGSEFDVGFVDSLSPEQDKLLRSLHRELADLAGESPGFTLERKPASIAFHYRNAKPEDAQRALDAITRGPASRKGVFTKRGKMVIELAVLGLSKGEALQKIRQRVGAHAVLYIGDDTTDEDAFRQLRGPDLGVKVGEGETRARARVDSPRDVARLLARLAERRAGWCCGGAVVRIDHHAMLSDLRTAALVTPDANVVWLSVPRIDSPALFGELVGGPSAGRFSIRPADGAEPRSQRYVQNSLAVVTEYPTFTITDYLDCTGGRPRQRAGRTDLVRIIRGKGRVAIEFAPRLDFGRAPTQLELADGGVRILDSPDPIVLASSGLSWRIEDRGPHQSALAEAQLGDEPVVITLRSGAGSLRPAAMHALEREEGTNEYWRAWASSLRLPSVAKEASLRSALTLKALTHGPTGAIIAAATTSLPETIGGVRNWDYRYCWVRDASLAAIALTKLGSLGEGMQLLDWLLGVVERATAPDRIQPLYTVTGDELATEGEIGELCGYAGSRPVRVGNAASRQIQLDEFGPVVQLVCELALRDAPLTPQHWRVVEAMVAAVRARWREPDHGIWEIRAQRKHHVHSKVMCWLTVDRALHAAMLLRDNGPEEWAQLRDEIARDALEHGWSSRMGAFTCAYGADELDAAALWVGLSGLLPPDDERFASTVEAIERELLEGPAVYRYRYDDGLPGFEGAFHLCTCWLILAYLRQGRRGDAKTLFDCFLDLAGPTGLYSEEYGVHTKRALGNHPQAYTHAGLIECALALDEAR